jgi:hypothetical protein
MVSEHVRWLLHEGSSVKCEIVYHKSSKVLTKLYFDLFLNLCIFTISRKEQKQNINQVIGLLVNIWKL